MCGICGQISLHTPSGLQRSLERMHHRGPDAQGVWQGKERQFNVELGHLRLAVVDLSAAANQPFVSQDGQRVLVYNGEIYNFRVLRDELRQLGFAFATESDTEVLLQAYAAWGIECVRRFDGMFAFALLDRACGELHLARDPLGIKPLYVWQQDQQHFAFASELRGLQPLMRQPLEADPDSFAAFLLNGWLYEPYTGFKGVEKLRPGEFRTIALSSGIARSSVYYDPLERPAPQQEFAALIHESMRLQHEADVRVGLFYSGGLDSSVLASVLPGELDGLFIDYEQGAAAGGDAAYALDIARTLRLPVTVAHPAFADTDRDAILQDFRAVARGNEDLIADYTYSASHLLAQDARARGYTVMLSGMGGDELFAGYPRYTLTRYRGAVRALHAPLSMAASALRHRPDMAKKVDRLLRFSGEPRFFQAYTSLLGYFSEAEVNGLLGQSQACDAFWSAMAPMLQRVAHLSPLKQAMYLDRFGFLAHNLIVTDKSSMANSIEMRVPLMSNALAELGFATPDAALIDYAGGKKPLRQLLAGQLSKAQLNRPKTGFNPPLDGKIRALGQACILDVLGCGALASVLDMRQVSALVDAHFKGLGNQTYKLWQLLFFNFWLENQRA